MNLSDLAFSIDLTEAQVKDLIKSGIEASTSMEVKKITIHHHTGNNDPREPYAPASISVKIECVARKTPNFGKR